VISQLAGTNPQIKNVFIAKVGHFRKIAVALPAEYG